MKCKKTTVIGRALFHAPVAAHRTMGGEDIEAVRRAAADAEAEAEAEAAPLSAAGTERKSPREEE